MKDKLKRAINVEIGSREHLAMIHCIENKCVWRAFMKVWRIVDAKRVPQSDWINVELEEVE